jgi:predicted transcriptional regulator
MACLWRSGPATADRIREQLDGCPHDSSVRTLLRVLEAKGYIRHEVAGKAYVYTAAVSRRAAQSRAARGLLDRLFRGSAADLVLRLLEDEEISPEELRELADQARSPEGTRKSEKAPKSAKCRKGGA